MKEWSSNQAVELRFFENFSKNPFLKLAARLAYLCVKKLNILKIIPLSLPIRCVPLKHKSWIMNLKYNVDLAVVKHRMPGFFNNDCLRFLDYSLSPLHTDKRADETIRVFSAIKIMKEIGFDGQYRVRECLVGKPNPVVLDCGANIGIFSLFAGHVNKTSEIYAFEPSSGIFKILEEVVRINGLGNIHPCKFALGDRNEDVSMLTVEDGLGVLNVVENSIHRNYSGVQYQHKENVKMLTMDEFVFNIKKLSRVDFIKIDTEGYERQILTGAGRTIKEFHPVITCSAYHLPDDKKEIPRLLLKMCPEYKWCLENKGEEDFVFWV